MENITLNITSERYPIIKQLAKMAAEERRSLAVMADILLTEALERRAK